MTATHDVPQTRIRPAQPSDTPTIGEIAEITSLFPSEMLDAMITGYLDQTTDDLWFVAERDGPPIGFGYCEPERMTEGTWNLLAIGVRPVDQSRGVGAAMLRDLEDRLRERAARILLVETMGTPEFERTRAFYRRNGFVEEARIRDFYEAGGDKVVFWKRL
ncbi:MAG: GNAT family N-acetyltransferase [Acidobacteriota bacterium]